VWLAQVVDVWAVVAGLSTSIPVVLVEVVALETERTVVVEVAALSLCG
jgi:hypothetical protein